MRPQFSKRMALVVAAGFFAALVPSQAQSQQDWDPRRVYMNREQLQTLLDRLELTAQSPAYSNALRDRTTIEANLIRARLVEGDFQVGDRIWLVVENEETLTDTFAVDRGRVLSLPQIGEVELAGLLRAELELTLTEYVGRFVRDPRVRARSLLPITITGAVAAPGFYTLPSEMRFSDALMAAGGYNAGALITGIRVERGDEEIWDEDGVQMAITEGRTLDQMSMRAGDYVIVPQGGGGLGGAEPMLRSIGYLLTIPLSIVALIAIF